MAKFKKIYYYTSTGEKKINSYYMHIAKEMVEKAGLENKEIIVKIEGKKIILEEK